MSLLELPPRCFGGELLRKLVSEDPRKSIVKPTQREDNSSGSWFFFFLVPIFKLFVCREGERKGRKGEGRLHGRVKAR